MLQNDLGVLGTPGLISEQIQAELLYASTLGGIEKVYFGSKN